MATYNRAHFIVETLHSIQQQTFHESLLVFVFISKINRKMMNKQIQHIQSSQKWYPQITTTQMIQHIHQIPIIRQYQR